MNGYLSLNLLDLLTDKISTDWYLKKILQGVLIQ